MQPPSSFANRLIATVGYGLIALGAWIAVVTVLALFEVYHAPVKNEFIAELKGALSGSLVSQGGASLVGLDQGGATIAALILLVILAGCGASVGIRLLLAGVQLLSAQLRPPPLPAPLPGAADGFKSV